MHKLTKRFVESAIVPNQKQKIYWDSQLKGFGLVVLPSGRRTYCVQYRNIDRKLKRMKVGVHGQINAEQARDLARKLLSEVALGEDPSSTRLEAKTKSDMRDLIKDYLEGHATKKRVKSIVEDKKLINNVIEPMLGNKKVDAISRRDIEKLHHNMAKRPYTANRTLSLLSKMFSLAIGWGWRNDNPAQGVERYQEIKRERWLSEAELESFCLTLNKYPNNRTALLFRLLLLTGARKGEAMSSTWAQFDLDEGIWTKPSHLTKQKKTERLPLSKDAVDVLKHLKELNENNSIFVFPGRKEGEPIKEIKTFWKKLLSESKIENFRIHDLRHTHAAHLVSSGMSLSIVGKLLGHTQASTTQRYAHLADEPLREAAELFSSKISVR